jgi:glycosyltransferase involved in cell wall biosynthesis
MTPPLPGVGRVAVLSFSRIARDRRVLRQCAALADRGELAAVIGFADTGDRIDYRFNSLPAPRPTALHRLSTVARQVPARFGTWAAEAGFWAASRHRCALTCLHQLAPSRVVANDWPALVVASAYKRAVRNVRIHYDSHEFAALEFDERQWWRLVYKPFVQRLETAHIGAADAVSTVGPRLADALRVHHRLAECPVVIRSIPDRIALEPRSAAWPLRLLYHGHVVHHRGLEALIDSMRFWTVPHHLTIRGDGDPGYVATLRQRAAALGAAARISFEPAVAPDDVVPRAAVGADVGVFCPPLDTPQRQFTLPNKLFEYIGAGLAVLVSPGADLRALVEAHGVGVVAADAGPDAVAAAVNALDTAKVERFRAAAREAAHVLCWEAERKVFDDLHDRLAIMA